MNIISIYTKLKYAFTFEALVLFVYVFSVVFFAYQEGQTLAAKLAAIFVLLSFLYIFIVLRKPLCVPFEFILLGVWLLYVGFTGLFSVDYNTFFNKFIMCLQVMGIAFLLCNLLIWLGKPDYLWKALFYATGVMLIISLQNPDMAYVQNRLAGRFTNANALAFALIVSFVYSINKLFTTRNAFVKLAFTAILPVIIYYIGESGSRKGMFTAIVYSMLFFVMQIKLMGRELLVKKLYVYFSVICIFVMVVSIIYHGKHYKRMDKAISVVESGAIDRSGKSLKTRIYFYRLGWDIFIDNPIAGVGLNNYRIMHGKTNMSGEGTYAHSNIIELLATTGIVGFVLYYSIYASLFVKLIKLKKVILVMLDVQTRCAYIATFGLLIIMFLYDFAMVTYTGKISWIVIPSIIGSVNIMQNAIKLKAPVKISAL